MSGGAEDQAPASSALTEEFRILRRDLAQARDAYQEARGRELHLAHDLEVERRNGDELKAAGARLGRRIAELEAACRSGALQLEALASRLASEGRPGHIGYVSKADAAGACAAIGQELERAKGGGS